jgi:hypothetical protein
MPVLALIIKKVDCQSLAQQLVKSHAGMWEMFVYLPSKLATQMVENIYRIPDYPSHV